MQEIGRYRGNEEEGLALSITTDSVWSKLYSMAWSNYNEGFIEFECEFLNHLIITPMNHEQVSLFPLFVCVVDGEKCILCLSLLVCRQL